MDKLQETPQPEEKEYQPIIKGMMGELYDEQRFKVIPFAVERFRLGLMEPYTKDFVLLTTAT